MWGLSCDDEAPASARAVIADKKKDPQSGGRFFLGNLPVIEFHDQVRVHLHGVRDIVQNRHADEGALHFRRAEGEVLGDLAVHLLHGFDDGRDGAGLFAGFDDVAGLGAVGRDGDDLAVDQNVLVADQLAGSKHGGAQVEAVNDAVEAGFEQTNQVLGSVALAADGFGVDVGELTLGNTAVVGLHLLLFTQLDAVVGHLLAAAAVLAGVGGTLGDGRFGLAPEVLTENTGGFFLRSRALTVARQGIG